MWDAECRLRQKQAQLAQTPHPPAQGARTRALETQRRWDGLLRHQMLELAGQWRSRAQELQCAVQKQEASGSVRCAALGFRASLASGAFPGPRRDRPLPNAALRDVRALGPRG